MDKISVSIDMSKIQGGFSMNIKGSTGTKDCICFPKDMFYQGKNGSLYLNITGFDAQGKFDKLYSLKQSVPYEKYKQLSEEQKKSLPFIGDIKPMKSVSAPAPTTTVDEDLPF